MANIFYQNNRLRSRHGSQHRTRRGSQHWILSHLFTIRQHDRVTVTTTLMGSQFIRL